MKILIKILWTVTKLAELTVYGLFIASMFTIVSTFAGSLTETDEQPFDIEVSPSGEITFSMKVKNEGLMETTMKVRLEIRVENEFIEGSDSVRLKPGEEDTIRITLKPTLKQAGKMLTQKPKIYITLEGKTLDDYASVGLNAELGGGL